MQLDSAHSKALDAAVDMKSVPVVVAVKNTANPPTIGYAIPMASLAGDTVVFDGNMTSGFNQKRDWDGQGTVPAAHIGKPILGVTYYYSNASPNHTKKVLFLDLYYHNGTSWVLHTTLTCLPYELNGPISEDYDLTGNPMPNPTGKVRIVGRGTVDPFSYRWVDECRVKVAM